MIPEHGKDRVKEVAMTRPVRLWITAVRTMAAMALMVGLAVAAHAGVNQAHPHPPLAGVTFNGIGEAHDRSAGERQALDRTVTRWSARAVQRGQRGGRRRRSARHAPFVPVR
jgi:hypothetical protein